MAWFERAVGLGSIEGMLELALRETDVEGQLRWLQTASRSDSGFGLQAQAHLAWMEGNEAEYRRLLENAFAMGDSGAAYYLGELLRETDPEGSRQWFLEARHAGLVVPEDVPAGEIDASD
jgi:hypothetical protein